MNGVAQAQLPTKLMNRFPVYYEHSGANKHKFTIELGREIYKENIIIQVFKDLVSIQAEGATETSFLASKGLLGDFLTGNKLARDGKTVLADPNAFGQEWQVRHDEPKLFMSTRLPQHPATCNMPNTVKAKGRRLGESIAKETAELACEKWGAQKDLCVFDVLATGDLEIADAGAF